VFPGSFREDGSDFSIPGPFQFRYELDESASEITVDIRLFDVNVTDPELIGASLVLRTGDEPIAWSPDGDSYAAEVDATAPLEIAGDRSARAVFDGPFSPGVYHLQLVNHGVDAQVRDFRVSHTPDPGGCGCKVPPPRSSAGSALILCALAFVMRRRSR
jgi:hypothetical protein